jgi:pimeloyl-ACP methyl ester carboxylesterase
VEVVRAHGLEIAYQRAGHGPPLVLVHAAGFDGRMRQPELEALADEFTVVAWDEPGAGRTGDLPPGFGLADYAHCLAALIEALGLGSVHLAGLSWGGTVVQELYRHHPDRVATLILAGSYAGWKGSLPAEEVRGRVAGVQTMLQAEERGDLPGMFAAAPPREFALLLDEMAAAARSATLSAQSSIMAETDQRDLLPHIAVPTLLIWGAADARSPLTVARQFADAIPNAELKVIPDAGHIANLEQPAAFNDAVRDFCRRHPVTSPASTRSAGRPGSRPSA